MSSTLQHQDRAAARTSETLDRLDLELQKAANAWVAPEARERMAQAAELLGFDRTAERIRETNERRDGWVRPELTAVPDDGRRPLRSQPNRPILVALEGELAPATDEDLRRAHMLRMARVAEAGAGAPWATPRERASYALAAERCRRAALG